MRFGGKRTELEPLAGHHNGDRLPHYRTVDRYSKVKKGNILLYGLVKVSAIPFRSRDGRFYHYVGVTCIFTFGLLPVDCDRYIGDIIIPYIVKQGFCSLHYIVTMAGLKNFNCHIGNFLLSKISISRFCCNSNVYGQLQIQLSLTGSAWELKY